MGFYADANDSLTAAIYAPDPVARIIHERAHGMPRGAGEYEPLRALMLAVLEDGIACYQGYFFQPTAANERLFLEAEEWIRSNDDDLFSFNNICDALGLDPSRIRKGLEQGRSGQAGKPVSDRRRLVANKARGKGTGVVKLFPRGPDEEQ